jgi:integrase
LNPSELQQLVAAGEPGFYQTLFLTAALSGMRHDELFALRWFDIDLQAGGIFVRRSVTGSTGTFRRVETLDRSGRPWGKRDGLISPGQPR